MGMVDDEVPEVVAVEPSEELEELHNKIYERIDGLPWR
ncbi:MAG: hypothetical protein ACI9F9_000683 [Candidatus Paceibacteria bacterium]|jgi:hypothetical protein